MTSLILGYIGTAIAIAGFQLKKQWQIIISQCLSNLLVALSYLFLDLSKITGGAMCLVGGVHTLINYFYLRKDKNPPKYIAVVFFFVYALVSAGVLYMAGNVNVPYDLLPTIGSMLFLVGVSSTNPRFTRVIFFFNMIIWTTYDFMAAPIAWANLVTHIGILISIIVGIVRYDILEPRKVKNTKA